jgi:kinesin family protein 4/21/27
MAAEMQHIRQQLEIAQAELMCARAGGPSSADIQVQS